MTAYILLASHKCQNKMNKLDSFHKRGMFMDVQDYLLIVFDKKLSYIQNIINRMHSEKE